MAKNKKQTIEDYPRVKINFSPKIPPLKGVQDKTKINIRYCVISPFAYIHIYWDFDKYELIYDVEEPMLDKKEKEKLKIITGAMSDLVDFNTSIEKNQDEILQYLDKRFKILAYEMGLDISYETYKKIYYYLCRDFIGFNEIFPLLKDYFVEDIECNGINTPVYLVHRIFRNLKTNVQFNNNDELASFVEKIAQKSGKYISYANPILDASLPDGSRVNATYTKDITSRGPTFTIRKFTKTPWTPPQLLSFKTLSPEMLAYMWILSENHMNILIAGGTASGKTTLLNALAFFIPPSSRVVSIEDTRELNLPRENWLPSVVRQATGLSSGGEINLFNLLKSSFRQNPDYVIVGEVRGKEAFVLFQGMASGHSSISTIHADSVDTVIKRLQTPPIELPPTLLNTLDCLCVMTHARVNKEDTRRLKEIVEITNIKSDGSAITNTPFVWDPYGDEFYFKQNSEIFQKISKKSGVNIQELNEEFRRRVHLLFKLFQDKMFNYKKFQSIVNEYYKQPEKVLNDYGISY